MYVDIIISRLYENMSITDMIIKIPERPSILKLEMIRLYQLLIYFFQFFDVLIF